MHRPPILILLGLGLFLVLFPLAVGKPGMPVTLKADEPAYLLMTLSLLEDGDLECDRQDIQRLMDRFPYLPIENLIVMTRDDWRTVYFGKPYLYSLLAVPAAALADHRGMVAFNMLLLMGMVWMGTVYLRRFNPEWLAALFAASFFLLSSAFAYVFWLQPEILNLFSIAACLFFSFHRFDQRPPASRLAAFGARLVGPYGSAAWSGALLAIAVYHKPMLALMGLPALVATWRRRGVRVALVWLLAAAISLGAIAGLSIALTGQANAYLGANRLGVKVEDPTRYEELIESFREINQYVRERHGDETVMTYSWLARVPELFPRMTLENVGYFLWGRHTGLLIYLPFAALCLLYFLVHGRRSGSRWLLLGSMTSLALFFLIWIHYNWHGGAGFIGNRYFVNAYPGFLFLVTAIRPARALLVGFAAAGLFVAPILFTPYGAPVPQPTLQAHTRGGAYDWLPVELSLRAEIPGYVSLTTGGVTVHGRRDLMRVVDRPNGRLWVWGAATTELWLSSAEPVGSLLFDLTSLAPDNGVTLRVGGQAEHRSFRHGDPSSAEPQRVELTPEEPSRVRSQWGKRRFAYRVEITTDTGFMPRHGDGRPIEPAFYVGAELVFLGSRVELERPHHFRTGWRHGALPDRIVAGERFAARALLANRSDTVWRSTGPLPVNVSWHWLDQNQQPAVYEGLRTPLAAPLAPGAEAAVTVRVRAPAEPGRYTLVLDAVREGVGWFSRFGADTLHLPVEVRPAGAEAE